jgi:hypothetical protein
LEAKRELSALQYIVTGFRVRRSKTSNETRVGKLMYFTQQTTYYNAWARLNPEPTVLRVFKEKSVTLLRDDAGSK